MLDLVWIFIVSVLFLVFFTFCAVIAAIALFHNDMEFLPRRYYTVRLFNRDTTLDKNIYARTVKGWVVKRKGGVQYFRIGTGFMAGIDLDIGFMRHTAQITDPKGSKYNVIDLLEKIPGVKDASNFEPVVLPYELEAKIERNLRQSSVSLAEIAQRLNLNDLKSATAEDLKILKHGLLAVKDDINNNIDKILDQDRRIQAAQVSGWAEFTATGIEKNTYRVQREDPIMKFMPYVGLFAIVMLIFFVVIFLGDFVSNQTQNALGPVVSSCNNAANMHRIMAQSCGWVPPETNETAAPVEAPPDITIPGLS